MTARSRLQGPCFNPAHAQYLKERTIVGENGDGWHVTDAARFFRPRPSSNDYYARAAECRKEAERFTRLGDERLEQELAESIAKAATEPRRVSR